MVALALVALSFAPTFTLLPNPPGAVGAEASALSDDGRVVYGRARYGKMDGSWKPCRWVGGRVQVLPLPERIDFGGDAIGVTDTVGDGRVAVGTAATMKGDRPCRWTNGRLELLPLPAGTSSANAVGVARDGTVIGTVQLHRQWRTVLWGAGKPTILPFPAGHSGLMVPTAISADGHTVVGGVDPRSGQGREAWEWTPRTGVQIVKDGKLFRKVPCGVSGDGKSTLFFQQGAEGGTGATVLERPTEYRYPDPDGTGSNINARPRMDAGATALAFNVIRHTDGARSSLIWTQRAGGKDIRTLLGPKLPKGAVVEVLLDIARSPDRRVVVIGSLEDRRPFLASASLP